MSFVQPALIPVQCTSMRRDVKRRLRRRTHCHRLLNDVRITLVDIHRHVVGLRKKDRCGSSVFALVCHWRLVSVVLWYCSWSLGNDEMITDTGCCNIPEALLFGGISGLFACFRLLPSLGGACQGMWSNV